MTQLFADHVAVEFAVKEVEVGEDVEGRGVFSSRGGA